MQLASAEAPGVTVVPVGHGWQALAALAPAAEPNVPSGHSVHAGEPALLEYEPAGQARQRSLPAGAYVPAPQRVQMEAAAAPATAEAEPAAQAVHEAGP